MLEKQFRFDLMFLESQRAQIDFEALGVKYELASFKLQNIIRA